MQIYTIETGFFKLDGGAMFGVVPKSIWNKLNPADENNMCSWAMRCLLIQDENRLVLIDNGMGNKQSEKFFSFYDLHGDDSLEKSLQKAGFQASDMTDMFLTHLHFDHCGGGVVRQGEQLVPTFKNANYYTHSAHWKWATQPNPREKASFLKENLLPMQESGQLIFADQQPHQLPFAEIITVDGHTEKQMLPLIHYKGKKVLFCGDLFPSAAHIHLPYVMAYDVRPLLTMQEKEYVLQRAVTENWILYFEHDKQNECATVVQKDGKYSIEQTFLLKEI
jgi:glyoxylase-like metal-dependent hydrolase (beta-lactamase superfamily II)